MKQAQDHRKRSLDEKLVRFRFWRFCRFNLVEGFTLPIIEKSLFLGFNIFSFYRVAFVVLFPTKLDLLDSDFICKSYGSSRFLMDLARRWSGVSGPTGVSGPKDPESPVMCFSLPNAFLWCGTGLGSGGTPEMDRSLRPKGPGISSPRFYQVVCVFVVRFWIGVRNTPGECPESPALWTGLSGLPR